MGFSYKEYMLGFTKNTPKTKLVLPDPTGNEQPFRLVLQGSAAGTEDADYAELAAAQEGPVNAKQKQPETTTKVAPTLVASFQPGELSEIFLQRQSDIEELADKQREELEERKRQIEEQRKSRKKKDKEVQEPVNRVAELTGSNGQS